MNRRLLVTALLALAAGPAPAESLYNAKHYRPLVADRRAHQPGDILTILVYENSSASTAAETAMRRQTDIGVHSELRLPRRGPDLTPQLDADIGAGHRHAGGGTVQRTGKLLAQLSVTVNGMADNGDLLVRGEQVIEVNDDKQHIMLEGRVRRSDISDANTVLSTRLADARISYAGSGALAARQRPGLLSRLFVWMGL